MKLGRREAVDQPAREKRAATQSDHIEDHVDQRRGSGALPRLHRIVHDTECRSERQILEEARDAQEDGS